MDDVPVGFLPGDDEIVSVGGPLPHVEHVEVVAPGTLLVRFDDGLTGHVRFSESKYRGVFAKLKDPEYFAQVGIAYGAVSWPNEDPDLSPSNMHRHFAHAGEWILN